MRPTKSVLRDCIFALAVIALAAPRLHAEDYKIKLVRPDKVGDEYASSVTAKFSKTTVTMKNGEETDRKTDAFTAACQGTVKVLAIDEKTGIADKIRFQVDSLTKASRDLYPQGTVIICKRSDGDTSFEIEGERPDEENAAVLHALLGDVGRNHGLTNEAEAKASQPQSVGSTWPINTEKIATEFAGEDSPITADELKGESQLVSVKKVDGKDAMVVQSKISAGGFKKDLDEGRGSISDGKLTVITTDVLPVDESLAKLSSTTRITLSLTISPPLGSSKSIVTTKLERKERRDPAEDQ
jgi:hypothetical protein